MERYAEYKDSGVAWIGEIPVGWDTFKLKALGTYQNGYAFKPEDWSNEGLPIVRIQDLTGSYTDPNFYNGSIDSKYLLHDGDVLVSWAATIGVYIWNGGRALLNQHIFNAHPNSEIVSQEYFYWLLFAAVDALDNENKHGIMMEHLTLGVFNNFKVALPPLDEQRAIAAWLDEKCTEVDGLVADTERSIELLEEYRRSVISEAVTKGLDPNVPMKDSGIERIGEIPRSWDAVALKRLAIIQSGATPDRERSDYWGGEIGWIKTGELQDCVIESADERITEMAVSETAVVQFPKDTVLVAMYGQGKTRGMTGLLGFESTTNQACAGIIANDKRLLPRFLWWFMRGSYRAIREKALGSGQPNLSVSLISAWKVTLPPLAEQRTISAHLDEVTAAIDSLIADKRTYVERLREYRKSLISEAVTGKFKVPGVE